MIFDLFMAICQTKVDGIIPSEKTLFNNFFDQIKLADELGYKTAWVAETHLSTEVQKNNKKPVVPHFSGEIGLNTDILQLAHKVFAKTKNIEVGSAIMNILCNGGPIAHAERIKSFLSLHELDPSENRSLRIGFAAGRFDFSNRPYGILARNEFEEIAWSAIKRQVFCQATEIFCRSLKSESFSSKILAPIMISADDFKSQDMWDKAKSLYSDATDSSKLEVKPFYSFEEIKVIPQEVSLKNLDLIIGSHDPKAQVLANKFLPCKVFNLSITPSKTLEETHQRMYECYHKDGGPWKRIYMPRTSLIFINAEPNLSAKEQRKKAKERAQKALINYWKAIEGTIDNEKIENAIENALMGSPEDIVEQIEKRYHPQDRLMLWFDFNCHDNELIKNSMRAFMEKVIPKLRGDCLSDSMANAC